MPVLLWSYRLLVWYDPTCDRLLEYDVTHCWPVVLCATPGLPGMEVMHLFSSRDITNTYSSKSAAGHMLNLPLQLRAVAWSHTMITSVQQLVAFQVLAVSASDVC